MKRSERIKYHILLGLCRAVGSLPDWLLYGGIGRMLYWTLYRVVRYRVKVVRSNLSHAFPEKGREELRRIERDFYRHLSEVFIDTISLSSITAGQMRERLQIDGLDEHLAQTAGRPWIAMMAHYGSWEYFGAYQLYDTASQVIGVYHPLHDKAFDAYYHTVRSRFGLLPVSKKELVRFCLRHRGGYEGRPLIFGMIADQRPPREEHRREFGFLNRPTHFYMGSDWLARRFALPVYFMQVQKCGRAHYRISFQRIYDGTEPVEEGTITQRYIDLLEQMIRRTPHLWMWSHRRWKSADLAEEAARKAAAQTDETEHAHKTAHKI